MTPTDTGNRPESTGAGPATKRKGALSGITVLDMTRLVPGPFCTMLLADLGADVIKIEPPGATIDQERLAIPFPIPPHASLQKLRALNPLERNKKSICLNLKTSEGQEIFYKLARRSDVIIEGFRPGVVKRLGADYETVAALNPRVVYCSITGYGQTGPYRDLPSHDINFVSVSGALGLIGSGGRPVIPLNLLGDFAGGGLMAAFGILAAIIAREQSGRGQFIDIAMTDGVASLLLTYLCGYNLTGTVPAPGGVKRYGGDPFYNVYETKDRKFISLGCREPLFIQNLCRALGKEEWAKAEMTESKMQEIAASLRQIFLTRTRDEWFDYLAAREVSVSKVNRLDELADDPQLKERGMVLEFEDPAAGKLSQIGISIKLSATPGSIENLGHTPGQDTDLILRQLGYSDKVIMNLRKTAAVG